MREQNEVISMAGRISIGLDDPSANRKVAIVVGMSCNEEVLITTKSIIL